MKRLLLATMLTVVCAAPAFAQMGDMEMKGARHGHGQHMEMGSMDQMSDMMGMCLKHADKLGLSDDQADRFAAIHRVMEKKHVRFSADEKLAEMDLMEIMEVKDFDLVKAGAAAQKVSDLKMAHHLEMLKAMREVRGLLTDDQFKKMKKMMPAMAEAKESRKMVKKHK